MKVHIYILCYNEEVILPHTVEHYRRNFKDCEITIYDNKSTDESRNIAKDLSCNIIVWDSNDEIDDYKYKDIKNSCWKNQKEDWAIVIDMDEWLVVNEEQLQKEQDNGVTILKVKGVDMMGESKNLTLDDIDLHKIRKGINYTKEDKNLCFRVGEKYITEMNYDWGAHNCNPKGNVKFSEKTYINKHMSYLGLNFVIDKIKKRFQRSARMRSVGMAIHYTNDINHITNQYKTKLKNSFILEL